MKEIIRLTHQVLNGNIHASVIVLGEDYSIILTGGDKEHIGSISMATPRKSLSSNQWSATVSTFVYPGHKDEHIGNLFAHRIAAGTKQNVVVQCGIHFDNINIEQILEIEKACKVILEEILSKIRKDY